MCLSPSCINTLCQDTKFDPETLKRDMTEFEVIAGKVNDLSNQSADLVLSGVQGIIARRNAIDDKARLEKANLHDLEKKLAYVFASRSFIF